MNHLTGMILPPCWSQVGEERFAWRCIGIGKDVRRRPRVKSTRPAVAHLIALDTLHRLPDVPASRGEARLPCVAVRAIK